MYVSVSQNSATRFDELVRPYFDSERTLNAQIASPHEFFRSYCETRFDFRTMSQRRGKRRSLRFGKQVESLIVLLSHNRRAALFRWK